MPQQTQELAIQIADSVVRVVPANGKPGTTCGKRRDELQSSLGECWLEDELFCSGFGWGIMERGVMLALRHWALDTGPRAQGRRRQTRPERTGDKRWADNP